MKKTLSPLAKWMEGEGLTAEALAIKVGRDRTRVVRWRANKGTPDIEALAKLETLSGGLITAKSFVGAAA